VGELCRIGGCELEVEKGGKPGENLVTFVKVVWPVFSLGSGSGQWDEKFEPLTRACRHFTFAGGGNRRQNNLDEPPIDLQLEEASRSSEQDSEVDEAAGFH
jgi:hypothetical protein